ncbi:MAG: hypothetical protein HOM25_05060 [Rhodospirillaceae bacterium]|jgi:hypothetical protein|nr:hypothetical protein [Rhodospirillaceae bacterium]MBT5665439.1 hypothetical protein [Rhodospirillaceae bacterium]MBT5811177.1 hypothetical protein [Rhodospirillaceae bacterium]
MEWPKLPNGSVDWMTVFQAPNVGFIPLIEQSDTCEKLHACFLLIIDSLFTRTGDADVRRTYHETAADLFAGAADEQALSGQKVKLRMVMMRVMNDRTKRAHDHIEAKAKEIAASGDARVIDQNPTAALNV